MVGTEELEVVKYFVAAADNTETRERPYAMVKDENEELGIYMIGITDGEWGDEDSDPEGKILGPRCNFHGIIVFPWDLFPWGRMILGGGMKEDSGCVCREGGGLPHSLHANGRAVGMQNLVGYRNVFRNYERVNIPCSSCTNIVFGLAWGDGAPIEHPALS